MAVTRDGGRVTGCNDRSFLRMARGSALEVQAQLMIVPDIGLGDPAQTSEAEKPAERVSKMLWAITQKLQA